MLLDFMPGKAAAHGANHCHRLPAVALADLVAEQSANDATCDGADATAFTFALHRRHRLHHAAAAADGDGPRLHDLTVLPSERALFG